ncbi:31159_t:CDS:2, partial [Racocetra persica]
GNDAIYEIFKKHHDFDFKEGSEVRLIIRYIFPHASLDINKGIKIIRNFFKVNISRITNKIHQSIIEGVDIHVGECVEPKLVKNPNELFLNIFLRIGANLIVGE